MEEVNQTFPEGFTLLGLSDVPYLQVICVIVFSVMYIITLSGNLLLITVVRINPKLHTPMYFFLCNLSIIDISFSSTIVPRLLINTLSIDRSISLVGCALQMYVHLGLAATECVILANMAYDRFAAICRPLHYNTIMNKTFCVGLAAGAWSVCFINSFLHVFYTFQLSFCKSHHVQHFFCEEPPFLRMSCQDTWLHEITVYISASALGACPFCLIIISYIQIISTILKIRSSQGRRKAFSTCGSHVTVVGLYFGTILLMYLMPPANNSDELDKTMSILYTVVTPMLNPMVYSIRNKDVKDTIKRGTKILLNPNY